MCVPEAGYPPIPSKRAREGVEDAVRNPDARMSGAAFGPVALQVAPEATLGGPLALVRNGGRTVPGRHDAGLRSR